MVFHSPHPDLNIPPYRSLPDFLLEHPTYASADPTSTLGRTLRQPILYGSPSQHSSRKDAGPLSLLDLRARARAFATALLLPPGGEHPRTPWQVGDVLLLFATSQHDYAAAVLGCQIAGGTAALANPSYKAHELAHQLRLVGGPKAILTLAVSIETVNEAIEIAMSDDGGSSSSSPLQPLTRRPDVWVFEEDHAQSWFTHLLQPGTQLLQGKRAAEAKHALEAVQIDPAQDTAVLCFSSGTSGLPKAVRLSHTNMISNLIQATFLLADRLNEPLFDDGNWYTHATTNSAAITPTVKTPARKSSALPPEDKMSPTAQSQPSTNVPRSSSIGNGLSSLSQLPSAGKEAAAQQVNVITKALRKLPFVKAKSQRVTKGSEFHIDILPQFHCYGLLVSLIALHTATPRIVLHRFEPDVFLQAVQDRHVTFAFVVPPILLMLAKSPVVDSYDISSLRRVASGAASLSQELVAAVRKRTGIVVTDGYGMSEMSPIISLQTLADLEAAPGTVGTLAPSTKARVLSPDGKDLGPNGEGELVLTGPQMMQGYLRNDEANASAFLYDKDEDEQGGNTQTKKTRWLRTGDVVRIDERGYITITDRLKDVIKANGFQVSPAELESILFQDPHVGDVAVLGVKDPSDGSEKPWAFIVPAAPHSPSSSQPSSPDPNQGKDKDAPAAPAEEEDEEARTKAVMERFNGKVAGYKRLKGITWVDKLPKSDSGKILKRELRGKVDLSKQ